MKLANRFEILEILDRGSYGITYRGIDHHQSLRSHCVIQELICNSPKILEMFRQEASILETIGIHSRIPKLLAYFDQDNKFYIVQDMIHGHTLRDEIKEGKRLDETYVIKLLKDIFSVLVFVHQHHTVHRNIHPKNLIRQSKNGDIFLSDFGSIKELSNSYIDEKGRLLFRVRVGAPGYVAPEQKRGNPCYASDLYSVGMLAIAALEDISPQQLSIHPITKRVQWSNDRISPALATFLKRLIEPSPKQRFQTAADALRAFEKTITGIRVGQDSQMATHVAARAKTPVDSEPVTKPVELIPPKFILKIMGVITAVLLMLGFGVKGYQWAAYNISRRWDAVTAAPQGYDEAKSAELVALLDDGSIQARPEMVDAFWSMVAAAKEEGVELLPLAGYLSLSEQRRRLKERTDIDVKQWLQQSDYHTGYAVAIGDKNAEESTDWDISFEKTDGYRWLRRYAKNYGFELSYPQGNPAGEKEPWHWRYSDGLK
ncbi:MAG: D-alanyl-D-alanine carboxypeptidase family protein [Cyanobacteria bacterium P01_H01_bin.21]